MQLFSLTVISLSCVLALFSTCVTCGCTPPQAGTVFDAQFGPNTPSYVNGYVQWTFGGGKGVVQWQPHECDSGINFFLSQTWASDGTSFQVVDAAATGYCPGGETGATTPCDPKDVGVYNVAWGDDCQTAEYLLVSDTCTGRALKWDQAKLTLTASPDNEGPENQINFVFAV